MSATRWRCASAIASRRSSTCTCRLGSALPSTSATSGSSDRGSSSSTARHHLRTFHNVEVKSRACELSISRAGNGRAHARPPPLPDDLGGDHHPGYGRLLPAAGHKRGEGSGTLRRGAQRDRPMPHFLELATGRRLLRVPPGRAISPLATDDRLRPQPCLRVALVRRTTVGLLVWLLDE